MFGELKPHEIEVGKQYMLCEKYYMCADVTVIADECGAKENTLRSSDWVGWKVRVDKSYGGQIPAEVGNEFSVGRDEKYAHYSQWKFKPLGSMPDYTGFDGEKSWHIGIDLAKGNDKTVWR
jgi:hypothetical protein